MELIGDCNKLISGPMQDERIKLEGAEKELEDAQKKIRSQQMIICRLKMRQKKVQQMKERG
jgi:hypothetical protein